MLLSNKKDNKAVRECALELFSLEQERKSFEREYQQRKTQLSTAIKNFMYCNKVGDEIEFCIGSAKVLRVKKIAPKSVTWNAEALEKSLGKLSKQVIQKTYTITDFEGMARYLKSYGVDPLRFREFLLVEKKVNEDALDQLNALGELTEEQLRDCYTVTTRSSYLRLDVTEGEK